MPNYDSNTNRPRRTSVYRADDEHKSFDRSKQGGDKPYRSDYKKPYTRDNGEGGYRKPYNRDGEGYKKPYDRDSQGGDKPYRKDYKKPYDRDNGEGGYRKPYNRDNGEGYKKPYDRDSQGGDKPYRKDYKKPYDRDNGEGGYHKPYNRDNGEGFKKPYERDGKKPYRKNFDERPAYPERDAQPAQGEDDEQPFLLIGRNAVREAIKAGRSIDRVLVSTEQDGSLKEIVGLARDSKLVIREVDRRKLDDICMPFGHGGKTANHQGIIAYAAGVEYCTVEDILKVAEEKGEPAFVVVLDEIEDPHNLGSIIRSAECAGAHGVVIGKRRSASVTAAAVKASAGASEYMKIARVVNIATALNELKQAGLWIASADMEGQPMQNAALSGPLALVIGSEGNGLGKLVKEQCDFLVSIPMRGHIDSLNAGVAAGILMFEKRRQDEM